MTDSRSDTPRTDEALTVIGVEEGIVREWDQLIAHARRLERELAACKTARDGWMSASDKAQTELAALRAAKAEPVAWRRQMNTGVFRYYDETVPVPPGLQPAVVPLYAHPPIPEGYVMVPLEANDDMVDAGQMAKRGWSDEDRVINIYKAMLAAAPQPPGQEGERRQDSKK